MTDNKPDNEFEKQAQEESPGIVREFFQFMRENKKWWLLPIVVVLILFGALIALGPGIAPFIYTLF